MFIRTSILQHSFGDRSGQSLTQEQYEIKRFAELFYHSTVDHIFIFILQSIQIIQYGSEVVLTWLITCLRLLLAIRRVLTGWKWSQRPVEHTTKHTNTPWNHHVLLTYVPSLLNHFYSSNRTASSPQSLSVNVDVSRRHLTSRCLC